jgi:sporulation protein YlmC with PRC-barrel domain
MKHPCVTVCGLLLAAAAALPAVAQGNAANAGDAGASGQQQRGQQLYRGSKIIGSVVRDARNRKIGEIKDLVLDADRGEVAYAIVNFGGVMGVGAKYHALPWQTLEASDDGKYYVLHADRETIMQAPGFDRGRWPDMADRKWAAETDRYWSRMVGRAPSRNNRLSASPGVAPPPAQSSGK